MNYSDLVKNREAVDKIVKFREQHGFSLVSQKSDQTWFELNLAGATKSGVISLMFFHDGDCECLAIVNTKDRTLDVSGSKKYAISPDTTRAILKKSFEELL
ncbi:hypothetical protein [Vibrio crassostreae]|uniref:hypothetical protein n=1 Tax=Vibrio crassostreae TaxID=246167 RepID=UPI001B3024F4|nr:hypothetical protein [Vibrio crassostreae]